MYVFVIKCLSIFSQYKANCVERLLEEPVSPASSPVVSNKPWKWSPGGLTPIGGAHYLGERLESPVGSPTRVPCSLGGEGECVVCMYSMLLDMQSIVQC